MAEENIITEFYKDCEVFITGGSGIVGKATIEKLLRSCDVKRIYMLLRPNKYNTVEERLEKIKNAKTQKPKELDKLVAIAGDVTHPNLGITPEYAKAMENVTIIFHCAATVRFNEPLDVALRLNVGGTWSALKFAETLTKLKIFLHVSTFFSNPYLKRVEEQVYPSPMDWELCLQMIQDESKHHLLDVLTQKITVGFPNSYCFTKNLSETMVNRFRDRLPLAIYRPSIVASALREPEPGFPSGMMGFLGIVALQGAGILTTVCCKKNQILDLTPLDVGTVVMLVQTLLAAKKYEKGNVVDIPLFQCSSHHLCSETTADLNNTLQGLKILEKFPLEKSFLIPHVYLTESQLCYKLMVFTHQLLPAALADALTVMCGRKPVMLGIMRKLFFSLETMKAFNHNNYESNGTTDMELLFEITEGTNFAIKEPIQDAIVDKCAKDLENTWGKIREVIFNEDVSTLDRAKKLQLVKKVLYNVLRGGLGYFVLSSIAKRLQIM